MSKYDPLWERLCADGRAEILLTFAEVQQTLGFPIDHSFLNYKKELLAYGYEVTKISLKEQTVRFKKLS